MVQTQPIINLIVVNCVYTVDLVILAVDPGLGSTFVICCMLILAPFSIKYIYQFYSHYLCVMIARENYLNLNIINCSDPITLEGQRIELANHKLLVHRPNLYMGYLLVHNEKDTFCTAQAKWIKKGTVHLEDANNKLRRVTMMGEFEIGLGKEGDNLKCLLDNDDRITTLKSSSIAGNSS